MPCPYLPDDAEEGGVDLILGAADRSTHIEKA
jgi:hypothetical protein